MKDSKNLWNSQEREIFSAYDDMCANCGEVYAVTLHEIVPKSLDKNWNRPENRIPLCDECHNWAHKIGTRNSGIILKEKIKHAIS